MKSPRDRARDALEAHHAKLAKKTARRRTNMKPERQVVLDVLKWCIDHGWSMQRIESKNAYNPKAGKWVSSHAAKGTPDLIGNTNMNTFAAIEAKAPGRLSTLRPEQRDYLINKISSFCFGAVVDSVDRLELIYNEYLLALEVSREKAKQLLLNWLPK